MRLLGSGRASHELPKGKEKTSETKDLEEDGVVHIHPYLEESVAVASRETPRGPTCCKCGALASNGKTVYSCSARGSCRTCKKYGGQRNATRKPAPHGGKCVTGRNIG